MIQSAFLHDSGLRMSIYIPTHTSIQFGGRTGQAGAEEELAPEKNHGCDISWANLPSGKIREGFVYTENFCKILVIPTHIHTYICTYE